VSQFLRFRIFASFATFAVKVFGLSRREKSKALTARMQRTFHQVRKENQISRCLHSKQLSYFGLLSSLLSIVFITSAAR
jgi:hypothetical protein